MLSNQRLGWIPSNKPRVPVKDLDFPHDKLLEMPTSKHKH